MLENLYNAKYFENIQIPDFIKKTGAVLYKPYKWFVFLPFLVISTILLGVPGCFIGWFISPKLASRISAVTWAKLNAWATPMFVSITGKENIDRNQSYVIVCNHQSHYDIFLLYGWLGIDFKWVMKKELRKVPVLGEVCDAMGHIYIDRSDSSSAVEEINRAKERIVNGTSVLFFPEGTRSLTGKMGQFKKGAFKMALDLGIPVLPITINGTRNILPAKSLNLLPGNAGMIIHEPVDTAGYTEANIEILIEKTRNIIEGSLE
jgi:1-acyl-sn-glycerol-3-phosphate acyltransferase